MIVWMIPKIGKLLLCYEGSGCYAGEGGDMLGSVFGWTIWVLDVGYVICRGGGG
jgi:hypothetical protein